MLDALKRFLTPPALPGDEDKAISAVMAHYAILFGLLANVVHLPVLILSGDPPARSVAVTATVIAALTAHHALLRRGHVRGPSALFLAVGWAVLAAANYTAGGVRAPGYAVHVVFVICAAFILGGRGAFLVAGSSTLLGFVFLQAERGGLLPAPQVGNGPARSWILLSSIFFVTAAIVTLMASRMRAALAAGRRELLVRQEAERRLERNQADLERTVRERTESLAEANDALRREKDFIARLMETSPVGIVVIDAEGAFCFANASAAQVLRRPRADLARLRCTSAGWDFTDHQGRPVPAGELPFFRALRAGESVTGADLAAAAPDGQRVLLRVNAAPLGGDGDLPRRCVATLEDVTERRRLEHEMLRAQKLDSIGVLAGGIAHDFNNLLTGIMGNISLAQLDVPAGSETAASLGEAEKAALQARELTGQLLTFSRGGAPVTRPLEIAEVVADATRLALRGSKVRCACGLAPDLWPVEADQGQIGQVFHNLAINARQAMPAGGALDIAAANVVLEPGSGVPLAAGRYVKVAVTDHGCGIPPENLEKIFDPFFTTKQGGTGLGLAVVYSIVKNHRGFISARSTEGNGATFTIHLPASAGAPRAAADSRAPVPGRGRVLVMDDEPSVRTVAAKLLAALGYEAQTAEEGSAAIATYRGARAQGKGFDVVVLDLTVPGGMGGAETIQRLREVDPSVRAVVSSGYSNDPVLSRYREYGFCHVITKPYRLADLSRVIHEACAQDLDGVAPERPSARGDAALPT